jgi:hypothetical protein
VSLKTFHLIFILASIVLAFGIAVWEIDSATRGDGGAVVLATLSALAGIVLVVYGIRVRMKLKQLGEP